MRIHKCRCIIPKYQCLLLDEKMKVLKSVSVFQNLWEFKKASQTVLIQDYPSGWLWENRKFSYKSLCVFRVRKSVQVKDTKNKVNGGTTWKISHKRLRPSSELRLSLKSCLNWYYNWKENLTAQQKGFS